MGLGGDLAFVESCIAALREFNLKSPIFGWAGTDDTETLIRCVGVATDSQDVHITVTYPRDLY